MGMTGKTLKGLWVYKMSHENLVRIVDNALGIERYNDYLL